LAEALRLARAVGAEHLAAAVTASLGSNAYDAGDVEAGLGFETDAAEAYRRLGPSALPDLVTSLAGIAKYLIALGRYDEAWAYALEAFKLAREVRYPVMIAMLLQELTILDLLTSHIRGGSTSARFTAAAHIFGFIDNCLAKHGIPKKYGLPEYDRVLELLREAIGADEVTCLMAAGATMSEDEAIAQAHALE
jgi:tetratricopeptide (TPR) repeat protein